MSLLIGDKVILVGVTFVKLNAIYKTTPYVLTTVYERRYDKKVCGDFYPEDEQKAWPVLGVPLDGSGTTRVLKKIA